MWGPIALLTVWFVSVPLILILGITAACVRRADPPADDAEAGP
jgi:hypothetical protein